MKKWYASRMVWVNMLTVAVGIIAYLSGNEIIQNNPSVIAGLIAIQGVVNVVLRLITKKTIA